MSDADSDATRADRGGWQPPQGAPGQPPPPGYWSPPQGAPGQPPPPGYWDPQPQPPPPPPGSWPPPPYGVGGPVPQPPRRSSAAIIAAIAAGAVLLTGVGVGWGYVTSRIVHSVVASHSPIQTVPQIRGGSNGSSGSGSATSPIGTAGGGSSSQPLDVQAVSSKVGAATVDINTIIASLGQRTAQAAGTGMVLTSDGEVLTNNHVIDGASRITVTIQGRSGTFSAHLVGTDPTADVALIQIEGVTGLPTVTLADSSTLSVGEQVVAMGNALGQGGAPSVTQGQITALDQSITASSDNGTSEELSGLIQSDAQIQPGDSGGPLVNAAGQVVGMITAGEAQGFRRTTSTIGYAIPATTAVNVVNDIRAGRSSSTVLIGPSGYLGVSVRNLDPNTAAQNNLSVSRGAFVVGVAPGSPAEQIGITANSVITAVDGKTINSSNDLTPTIQGHKPGQQIRVTWVDQNGTHTATATLITRPIA